MTGAAWLSSVRAVRCLVKSTNERNPCVQSPPFSWALWTDCLFTQEEGGDDVKSVWPLRLGPHTCYNGRYRRKRNREVEQIPRTGPSSDRSLQPGSVKSDSLVTAYQLRRREYVPGPCTHRPSHHESRLHPKSVTEPARDGAA